MSRKPALGTVVCVSCDSSMCNLLVEVTERFALAAVILSRAGPVAA